MNENKDGFIGSLISLDHIHKTVRINKCKCMIQNYELEETQKDDLNKKMKEVNITEKTGQDDIGNFTL